MSLSTFVLGLFVFLLSAPLLDLFTVDPKFLGWVGVAFVVCLVLEALRGPLTIWKRD